jgi:hypothetical protein
MNFDEEYEGPSAPMISDVRESERFEIFRGWAPTRRVMIATTPKNKAKKPLANHLPIAPHS